MTYQIEVDFDVYRELMVRRPRESITFNDIIADALGFTNNDEAPNGPMGYRLRGTWIPAVSANELLVSVLRTLAKEAPEFLPVFAAQANARARTRLYVAQDMQALYPGRPDLVRYSSQIAPGWFVGTNISNRQKTQLLRGACDVAGLVYGRDLIVTIDSSTPGNTDAEV